MGSLQMQRAKGPLIKSGAARTERSNERPSQALMMASILTMAGVIGDLYDPDVPKITQAPAT